MQHFKVKTVTVALLAMMSSLAIAKDTTVQTDEVKVTASRAERELLDVNMSVSVITAEDIKRSSARNVGELLETVAGVRITNDGSQGMKRARIRGEDAFRTLVMIDGQRITEHKSMSGAPMLIDPTMIERIEVIKGPASVLYGSDAIGGAINIITKKGGEKPVSADVSAGINTASSGKNAAVSLYGASSGFKYRISGAIEDNENLDTPKGTMHNSAFTARTASGYLSYNVNEDAEIGLSVDHYDLEFGSGNVEMAGFTVDVPKWTRTKTALFGELKNISSSLARLRADAFYQKSDKDMANFIPINAGPMTGNVTPMAYNTTDQYGFSFQSDWQVGEAHYLIAGYELNYDKLDANSMTGHRIAMGDRVITDGIVSNDTYDGHQLTQAVYASMETKLPANLTLNYGARYTWVDTEMDIVDNLNGEKEKHKGNDAKVVFNAGILWRASNDISLRANYAQGYRNPLLQELYVDSSMGNDHGVTYANPDLKPETSDNFEVGLRYAPGPVNIDLALFYNVADDYIATLYKSELGSMQYDNIAEAKTFGAEVSASMKLGTSGFEPYVVLTAMRREFDDGNGFSTYDSGTPALTSRYGLRYEGMKAGLGLHMDAYLRSQTKNKYKTADGEDNYTLGGYTTANLTGGVAFGPKKQYEINAGLYNVFDKAYREQEAIFEPGRYLAVKFNTHF